MRRLIATVLLCLAAQVLLAPAQYMQDAKEPSAREASGPAPRKQKSIFIRPACRTPADQLRYADLLFNLGKKSAAMKQYRALVHAWPDAVEAAPAQYRYAVLLEDRGDHASAFDEFQYLRDRYATGFPQEEVLDRQLKLAGLVMNSRHGGFLFFRGYVDPSRALPLYQRIVDTAPNWAKSCLAQYNIGVIHEKDRDFEQATAAYDRVSDRYPGSPAAGDAAFRGAVCLCAVADANPSDAAAAERAYARLGVFLKAAPDHEHAQRAGELQQELRARLARIAYERAVFYDRVKQAPDAATVEYEGFLRRFPDAEQADAVRARLGEIQQKGRKP